MPETRNRIKVILNNNEELVYEGNYFIYREDWIKYRIMHFRDENGKHHRFYGCQVVIEEI